MIPLHAPRRKKALQNAAAAAIIAVVIGLSIPSRAWGADLASANVVQPLPAYPLKKSAMADTWWKGHHFSWLVTPPQALMVKLI